MLKRLAVLALAALTPLTLAGSPPERAGKSPDQDLPSHITRLTLFGERADWSPDGKRLLFLSMESNVRQVNGFDVADIDVFRATVSGDGQTFDFGPLVWVAFAYAVVGPLFLTNLLWFTAIDRVGASRASLFANLQPFFAVFFALVLLSESLHPLEIAGGLLIFAGIALDRIWHRPPQVETVQSPQ